MSVADRSVFQTDQTNLTVGGFLRLQRQCCAVAGLDGAVSLFVATIFELSVEVVPQFHEAIHDPTSGVVGKTGFIGFARLLWDSQG